MAIAKWDELEDLFNNSEGNYDEILKFDNGLKYLKLQTVSKSERLKQIAKKHDIKIPAGMKVKEILHKIYDELSEPQIEGFIREQYSQERMIASGKEDELYSQLNKIENLDWGGVRNNQLEISIVNNYVKRIRNFEEIKQKISEEIFKKVNGWVLSNWFSFWSNLIIESQFKDHPKVLPGIGDIEHIDFFWDGIPFDLKTTKFAQGYIDTTRKDKKLGTELQELVKFCKNNNITFNENASDNEIRIEIVTTLLKGSASQAEFVRKNIFDVRKQILDETIRDSQKFAIWNYENQGPDRFGDENRLFLILVDKNTTQESWKLKRKKDFIKARINQFLNDGVQKHLMKNLTFEFGSKNKKKTYHANCCVLFIVDDSD